MYVADPTPEKDYVGVLQKKKAEDAVGYRLLIDRPDSIDRQDLHFFDNNYDRLGPYNGIRVKITGKKLTGIINGQDAIVVTPPVAPAPPPAAATPPGKPSFPLRIVAC